MLSCNVSNLMTDDTSKFCFVIEIGKNAASDIDIPTWKRESVNRWIIQNAKRPGEMLPFGSCCKALTQFFHIFCQLLIGVEPEGSADLLVSISTHLNFLGFAEQIELSFSSCGIGCASAQNQTCRQYQCNQRI